MSNNTLNLLSHKFSNLLKNRVSVIFQRKDDQSFLVTDIAVRAFLDNPELYPAKGNEKLQEVIIGILTNKYSIIDDNINAVVAIG